MKFIHKGTGRYLLMEQLKGFGVVNNKQAPKPGSHVCVCVRCFKVLWAPQRLVDLGFED